MLVGAFGLVALPPLGGFWSLLELVTEMWANHQVVLTGIVLAVNWIVAFSLARVFGLIFAGESNQMTIRSPEPIWLMVVPMTLCVGFTLHLPLILSSVGLLPHWVALNKDMALALTWSSMLGFGVGTVLYISRKVSNPEKLVPAGVQKLLAFDFYTPRLYRSSVVLGVDLLSRLTDWLDRYLVDGFVNFIGLASLFSGEALKYNNSGRLQFYVLTISFCVAVISIIMSWEYLPGMFTAALSAFRL